MSPERSAFPRRFDRRRTMVGLVLALVLSLVLHVLLLAGPAIVSVVRDLFDQDQTTSTDRRKISSISQVRIIDQTAKKKASAPAVASGALQLSLRAPAIPVTPVEAPSPALKRAVLYKPPSAKKRQPRIQTVRSKTVSPVTRPHPGSGPDSLLPDAGVVAAGTKEAGEEVDIDDTGHPAGETPRTDENNSNETDAAATLVASGELNRQSKPASRPQSEADGVAEEATGNVAGKNKTERNNNNETDPMLKVFPTDARAIYQAKIRGLSIKTEQHWQYQGGQYKIETTGRKLGYRLKFISTGKISPGQGLALGSYTELINDELHRMIDVQGKNVTYGRPDRPKEEQITDPVLDINSLIYQLGMMFNGDSRNIDVIVNASRYRMKFTPASEETLKMPGVGKVQAIRIVGETIGDGGATAQIWLAPQYANYPLQITLTRKGEKITLRLLSLRVNNRQLLGNSQISMEDNSGQPEAIAAF